MLMPLLLCAVAPMTLLLLCCCVHATTNGTAAMRCYSSVLMVLLLAGACGCLQLLHLLNATTDQPLAISAENCNLRAHDNTVMDPEQIELTRWGMSPPPPLPPADDKAAPAGGLSAPTPLAVAMTQSLSHSDSRLLSTCPGICLPPSVPF